MDEQRLDDTGQRQLVRAIHSILLKWLLVTFVLGLAVLVAGEMLTRRVQGVVLVRMSSWLALTGVALCTGSVALGAIAWFRRETTRHSGFREERLPRKYRTIAWSIVAAAIAIFIIVLWYTTSRGLTSW